LKVASKCFCVWDALTGEYGNMSSGNTLQVRPQSGQ
jgi:hypothetical protein